MYQCIGCKEDCYQLWGSLIIYCRSLNLLFILCNYWAEQA